MVLPLQKKQEVVGQHEQGRPDRGGIYFFCRYHFEPKSKNDPFELLQMTIAGESGCKYVHLLMIGKGRAWRVSLVTTWDWWVPVCWARHVTWHENVLGNVMKLKKNCNNSAKNWAACIFFYRDKVLEQSVLVL